MARIETPQIEVLVDSAGEAAGSQILAEEQVSLLRTNKRKKHPGSRHSNTSKLRCCLKSKAVLVILCWNTLLTLMFMPWMEISTYSLIISTVKNISISNALPIAVPSFYSFQAVLYLLYPLAGCLADTKCGRYKTIFCSLWLTFWGGVFIAIGVAILACYLILQPYVKMPVATNALLAVGFGLPSIVGLIMLFTCVISFRANVIQFGMDQLRDSPAEDSVLFIHWFVFTSFVGLTIIRLVSIPLTFNHASFSIQKIVSGGFYSLHVMVLLFLLVSLCIAQHRRQLPWFMIESAPNSRNLINPYKLVYKVIKFAAQHKTPIRRSAFTYCEDELPSRMDLGKEKYGGSFTTEQVEDVKVFLGILRVLLMLGPMFGTHLAASQRIHPKKEKNSTSVLVSFFTSGGVTDFLIMVLIPVYICLLRPFIRRFIPGMLKRMGLGMVLLLLHSILNVLIDTVGHIHNSNHTKSCYDYVPPEGLSRLYLIFLHILSATGYMLFYIAAYEFICAQSPHAMKGLLIGIFFTIKGVFQLIGALILVSFTKWSIAIETPFLSCSFVYNLINILVGLIGLVAYTWVARRYQYRQRDEPDNIYRYAEEYYGRQNS